MKQPDTGDAALTTQGGPVPAASQPKYPLRQLINRSYLASLLVAIGVIEVLLLLLYFGTNQFISARNRQMLVEQVRLGIPHLTRQQAEEINARLSEITGLALLLQDQQQRYFANPELFPIPGPEPRFAVAPNGAFYKTNPEGSSLFYARTTTMTAETRAKARGTEAFDPLLRLTVAHNPNVASVYFNSHDDMNRIYPPIPDILNQYDPNMDVDIYNFYYLADSVHNPSRRPVWTNAYLDPAGHGWMISCVVPIYRGDFLEGVTGLDVPIERFVSIVLKLELPWESNAFLVGGDGSILAMSEPIQNILGLRELTRHEYTSHVASEVFKPDQYNIAKLPDATLSRQLSTLLESRAPLGDISVGGKPSFLAQAAIRETGWRLMVVVDPDLVFAPVREMDKLVRNAGIATVLASALFCVLMLVLLARKSGRLADRIVSPVHDLAVATADVGRTGQTADLPMVGISEIDRLSDNFNTMNHQLAERTRLVVEGRIREGLKEQEAELAYNAGLFESASMYIHNIGNSVTAMSGRLLALRRVIRAFAEYPEAFVELRKAHREAVAHGETAHDPTPHQIDRIEELFLGRLVGQLSNLSDALSDIRDRIAGTVKHQQDSFVMARRTTARFVQPISFAAMLETVVSDLRDTFDVGAITVEKDFDDPVTVRNQRFQLMHGFTNILLNAVDSIAESPNKGSGVITITLRQPRGPGGPAVVQIADNGCGIRDEDLAHLFSAGFTTKPQGHGLGLHSFLNFLNENNGSISASNRVDGIGAVFSVEVGNE